ncbi:uncharacterized protein LOC126970359 [Leptidea sinapis]|uniref:uncharacterized protein LOC126970356 n=1 Tax=Leptidea sinapis TaxID=189913 RepID=UPI0021C41600|nr:uncharacterized protein LOC126970356 [Leptidea sinapis]XP_050672168.1 uncharacterized protein LOC126970357 [Leptidea sinapis]XP_050672169.1 uncharacterized protein LOC126970359 [Leptidea sinapis]
MKMKALYIEKCKDMVKKRKQLSEQRKTMESSLDLGETETNTIDSLEGRQEMSSSYADLQNVTLTAAEKDQNSLPCYFEEKTPKTTFEMELDDNDAPPNISQCESEAMTEENQYKEKDQASNVLPENQCEESNALPYIVEGTSEVTMQPEIQNLGHRIIDFNHFTSELVKISQHKSLFKCGLSTMKLISEHRIGLQSEYTYGSSNLLICMVAQSKENAASNIVNISEEPKTKENSDDTVADTDKTADVDNFAFVDEDVADADDVSVVDSSEYIMAFSEY